MKEDKDVISNEYHELQYVADKFGVAVSDVMRAKEETQSSRREVVYERVQEIKNGKDYQ